MSNSKYIVPVTDSNNLYVVKSTFPKSRVGDSGIGRVYFSDMPHYDSFASKKSALDYADELVKVGNVKTVEVRHIIRIVHEK